VGCVSVNKKSNGKNLVSVARESSISILKTRGIVLYKGIIGQLGLGQKGRRGSWVGQGGKLRLI